MKKAQKKMISSGHGIYPYPKKKRKCMYISHFWISLSKWFLWVFFFPFCFSIATIKYQDYRGKKKSIIKKSVMRFYTWAFVIRSFEVVFRFRFLSKLFSPSTFHAWDLRHWYELIQRIFVWRFSSTNYLSLKWFKREWPLGAINLFAIISFAFILFFHFFFLKLMPYQYDKNNSKRVWVPKCFDLFSNQFWGTEMECL